MNLSRRGFLGAILAAGASAAIVRSGLIMPIKPQLIVAPPPLVIERGGLILMERPGINGGSEYRWIRQSLLGEPDLANVAAAQSRGWMAVLEMQRPHLIVANILPA